MMDSFDGKCSGVGASGQCFAIYRLPHADTCTCVQQTEGVPLRLGSFAALNDAAGFVLAPFSASEQCPVLLIRPDVVTELPVQRPSVADRPSLLREENFRDAYAIDFANYHAQLQMGVFRKIVLARRATLLLATPVPPMELFWQACQLYPRLFVALVVLPDGTYWLTATPEILLDGVGQQWRTIALAGTMQLHGDELLSEGETVRWSTKDIQEQRYVSTYIAECLERFSIDFSEEGPRTVRAANLVHLRSDFTFSLRDRQVGDLLYALHPTPAVCGLPKRAAFDFIVSNEHAPRLYYSGFMGPLNLSAATHLYVSLRCMHVDGRQYQLYAGGGILSESNLESEWAETEAKMQTMRALLVHGS